MNKQRESWNWEAFRCTPWEEMVEIPCDAQDIPLPSMVMMTELDYRRLTEDGVIRTLFEYFYRAFSDESDPAESIRFIRWQMDKLDCCEANDLYEYIYFGLKHSYASHAYGDQWKALANALQEYLQKKRVAFQALRHVLYACPGENNRVYAFCSDGLWRIWDASRMLDMPIMKECIQKDPDFFRKSLTVINNTVAWDRTGDRDPYVCIDIDPDTIYEEGKPLTVEELVMLAEFADKERAT